MACGLHRLAHVAQHDAAGAVASTRSDPHQLHRFPTRVAGPRDASAAGRSGRRTDGARRPGPPGGHVAAGRLEPRPRASQRRGVELLEGHVRRPPPGRWAAAPGRRCRLRVVVLAQLHRRRAASPTAGRDPRPRRRRRRRASAWRRSSSRPAAATVGEAARPPHRVVEHGREDPVEGGELGAGRAPGSARPASRARPRSSGRAHRQRPREGLDGAGERGAARRRRPQPGRRARRRTPARSTPADEGAGTAPLRAGGLRRSPSSSSAARTTVAVVGRLHHGAEGADDVVRAPAR